MKAAFYTKYGPPDVLQIREVEKPTPKDNEVLIKTYAASVTMGDTELRGFTFPTWIWLPLRIMFGLTKPRRPIPGFYLSGEIQAVGKDVERFKKGDQIYGITGLGMGAHAEYACVPEGEPIAIKPANMTFEEAAAVPLGLDALHFLKKADVRGGEKVLVNGAGGGIGTVAVQLARHFGAEVTAVDSADKLDMLRAIGADHVVDYRREDFTKSGLTYDVIFDLTGISPFSRCIKSLTQSGRYILANPRLLQIIRGIWTSATGSRRVIFEFANPKPGDLDALRELIEAGRIEAVVDRCFQLDQIVEAHRYIESGRKQGNVVLSIDHDD
ncbi:MAG: NAD(P)-dependent alcohol dehydrogenase [Geminicoccaceae bacterium]